MVLSRLELFATVQPHLFWHWGIKVQTLIYLSAVQLQCVTASVQQLLTLTSSMLPKPVGTRMVSILLGGRLQLLVLFSNLGQTTELPFPGVLMCALSQVMINYCKNECNPEKILFTKQMPTAAFREKVKQVLLLQQLSHRVSLPASIQPCPKQGCI